MKKTKIIALILSIFLGMGSVFAIANPIYDNMDDFEKNEGGICKSATDGCNTFGLKDGKISYGTEMFCEDHKEEWSCIDSVENKKIKATNLLTTSSISKKYGKIVEIENGGDGQQIYILANDGKKYSTAVSVHDTIDSENVSGIYGSNSGLYLGNNIIIYYTDEVRAMNLLIGDEIKIVSAGLSENDENFLKNLREDRVNKKFVLKIDDFIEKYTDKLIKYDKEKSVKINNKLIEKIERKISNLLDEYPQDISLPKNVNEAYLKLELIKLELSNIDFYNEDKLSCELDGNLWQKVGMLQYYDCVIQYNDGGKKCDSSNECEGNCIVTKTDGAGFCAETDNVFGCKNTIENVKAGEGILCID